MVVQTENHRAYVADRAAAGQKCVVPMDFKDCKEMANRARPQRDWMIDDKGQEALLRELKESG